MAPQKSPAVVALEQEQAAQNRQPADAELDKGLKDTFPASDPVSTTRTSIPTGVGPAESNSDESPRVAEALAASGDTGSYAGSATEASEEVQALRREVARLRESAAEIGYASVRVAQSEAEVVLDDVRDRVRKRPLAAVGIAALIGYIWGLTR
ncbi:hypothetical protein CYG48_21750 (plasmid) [Neorhizobium sp. SOG26]|uniref:hypothetical protein n=1 Tax=Neorhizobium sp. SOG26 TaxID=2060726 RepID=UPI000E584A00|nr:hypothetical protein [Neorhizobium sp. SOG26]AXV18359.1 hypothetical protein CYG48_21750 [Neorhizobium sp. SOG26]